jgi:hypothetical protein
LLGGREAGGREAGGRDAGGWRRGGGGEGDGGGRQGEHDRRSLLEKTSTLLIADALASTT